MNKWIQTWRIRLVAQLWRWQLRRLNRYDAASAREVMRGMEVVINKIKDPRVREHYRAQLRELGRRRQEMGR